MVTGHFAYWTVRLVHISPTAWTVRLHIAHCAYKTARIKSEIKGHSGSHGNNIADQNAI